MDLNELNILGFCILIFVVVGGSNVAQAVVIVCPISSYRPALQLH